MAVQLSVTVRNARLDSIETTIGTAPILRVLSGSMPANCAAAQTGTLIAEMTLPSDWMAAASSGSKAIAGTWQDLSCNSTGTVGYFRILDSTGTTCHLQGTAGTSGTDMIVSKAAPDAGESFTVTSFTLTDGNA